MVADNEWGRLNRRTLIQRIEHLDVQACHLIALLQKQARSNSRVNPAGNTDKNFFLSAHGMNPGKRVGNKVSVTRVLLSGQQFPAPMLSRERDQEIPGLQWSYSAGCDAMLFIIFIIRYGV